MPRLHTIRRVTCIIAGIICLALSARLAFVLPRLGTELWAGITLAVASFAIGLGLIAARFWARRLVSALCLVAALFLACYLNPFMASDTSNPPTVQSVLAWLIPAIIGLLVFAWLVDPPRQQALASPPAAT